MAEKPVPLTKDGLAKLQHELDHLLTSERPRVAHLIHEDRELAGAQNASEYEDAKNEQAHIEGRIIELQSIIQNAAIIVEDHDAQRVALGSKVTIVNHSGRKEQYTIVGSTEVDPKSGRISNESPVGRALLGRRRGEEIEVEAPAGVLSWTVVRIS